MIVPAPRTTGLRLFTRNGYDWSGRYPLIVEAALRIKQTSFVSRLSRRSVNELGEGEKSEVACYFLETSNNTEKDIDHNLACGADIIAPDDKTFPLFTKGKSIKEVLSICSLGKACQISGSVINNSHDEYLWAKIDSVSPK